MNRRPILALLVGAVVAACGTTVAPTNPYDPQTPPTQQAPGKLTGQVDQAVLPGGGQSVKITGTTGGASVRTATAGADGTFSFDAVAPDVYYAELRVAGFEPLIVPNIRVDAGQTSDIGKLSPIALAGAQGTLMGRLVFESGAHPSGAVARIELQVGGALSFVADAPIDASGAFSLQAKPATYTVTGVHALYLPKAATDQLVSAGAVTDVGTISLALNPASISGTVLVERIPDPVNSSPTAPGAGANVTLDEGSTTVAAADGTFALPHLPGGTHSFRVQLAGYEDPTPAHAVTLVPGQSLALADPITLSLSRGDLGGTVLTGDGQPLAGATVELQGTSLGVAVVPDSAASAHGSWFFSGLPVGSYQPVAGAPGYFPSAAGPVTVGAHALSTVAQLTLAPASGAFVIASDDPSSAAGFTRTVGVTLMLSFPGAAAVRASEDSTFGGGAQAFVPYSASLPFSLSPSDGTHSVYVQTRDAAGTPSDVFSGSIVLDRVKPAGPALIVEGGAAFTRHSPELALTLLASDAPGPGVDAVSGLGAVHLSRDGVLDGNGNLANFVAFTYQRDYVYLLPSGDTSDGEKDFWVQFLDRAGNPSDVVAAGVVVDTLPPSVTSFTIDPGPRAVVASYTDRPQVTLRLSASEQVGDSVLVKLANSSAGLTLAPAQAYAPAIAWSLDSTGTNPLKTVYARFFDLAGNTASDVSASITLDTTPPAIAVAATGLTAGESASRTVALAVTATDDSALQFAVSEDPLFAGASYGPQPTQFQVSAGDGPKTIFVRARDAAGNTADASTAFTLKTSAPGGTLQAGDGSGYTTNASVSLTLPSSTPDVATAKAAADTAPDCSTSGYTSWSGSQSVTLTGQGAHTVYLCLADVVGNFTATPLAASVFFDNLPPSGSAAVTEAVATGAVNTRFVHLDLSGVSDSGSGLAGMQVLIDSASFGAVFVPFSALSAVTLPDLDGAHSVNVRVKDKAGNAATLTPVPVTLDRLPPSGTVTPSASITNATSVMLTYTLTDVTGYTISSGPQDCASLPATAFAAPVAHETKTIGGAGEGTYTFYICIRDAAGNVAALQTSVSYDPTPPSATLVVGDGSGYTTNASVAMALVGASSDLAATQQLVDGSLGCAAGTYTTYTGSLSATLTGQGAHTIQICLKDAAGNVSAQPLSAGIFFDNLSPTGSAAIVEGANTNTRFVHLDLSGITDGASGSGLFQMQTLIDPSSVVFGSSWVAFQQTSVVTLPPADGLHTIYVAVKDRAGNPLSTFSASTTLDTQPPAATVTLVANGITNPSQTNATSVTLNYTYAADVTGYVVATSPLDCASLPAAAFATPVSTEIKSVSALTGAVTFTACFRDSAGNVAAVPRSTVINRTPPTGTWQVGNGQAYQQGLSYLAYETSPTATLMYAVSDSLPNCATVTPYGSFAPSQNVVFGAEGSHTVYLCLQDAAGNFGGPLSATVFADNSRPTAGAVAIQGTFADDTQPTANTTTAVPGVTLTLNPGDTSTGDVVQMRITNAASFTSEAWQPFQSPVQWTLPQADATYTVRAQFMDRAGWTTASDATGSIALHGTAPSGTSVTVAGGATATNNASPLVAVGETGAAQVQFVVNGASGSTSSAWMDLPLAGSATVALGSTEELKTVVARFRSDTRVLGPEASAQIQFKTTPPVASAVALAGLLGDGISTSTTLSATPAITVKFTSLSSDTAQIQLASTTGSCSLGIFGGTWLGAAPALPFQLAPTDGPQTVCAIFRDSAGNISTSISSASLTLDTHPPSNPNYIDVAGGFTNLDAAPGGATPPPLRVTASTDAIAGSNVTYQCIGGHHPGWQPCNASAADATATTDPNNLAPFVLGPSSVSVPTGTPTDGEYQLGVRACDPTLNCSQGSFVTLTRVTVPPQAPVITTAVPSKASVRLQWTASVSADVVGYLVNYGRAPGDATGSGAAQGASPIGVGNVHDFELTGLASGTPLYISVQAVDSAGNVGPPSGERLVVPNEINPRLISTIGGQMHSIGLSYPHVYLGENQAVVQLDASNDAAQPTPLARVVIPNFVPDSGEVMPSIACSLGGVAGDCIYATGITLEAVARGQSTHAQTQILYFPTAPGATARAIGTLPEHALSLHRVTTQGPGGSADWLVATSPNGIDVYSLATPTQPTFYSALPIDKTLASQFISLDSAGSIGNAFYLYLETSATPVTHLIRFADVSQKAPAVTDLGAVLDSPGGNEIVGTALMFTPVGPFFSYYFVTSTRFSSTIHNTVAGLDFSTMAVASPLDYADRGVGGGLGGGGAKLVAFANGHLFVFPSGGSQTEGFEIGVDASVTPAVPAWSSPLNTAPFPQGVATVASLDSPTSGPVEHVFLVSAGGLLRWANPTQGGGNAELGNDYSEVPTAGAQLATYGHLLLVASADNLSQQRRVQSYDVGNPLSPRLLASYPIPNGILVPRLHLRGSLLLASFANGFDLVRVNLDGTMTQLSRTITTAQDAAFGGKYVLVAPGSTAISQYDITTPTAPALTSQTYGASGTIAFQVVGGDDANVYAAGLDSSSVSKVASFAINSSSTGSIVALPAPPAALSPRGSTLFVSGALSTVAMAIQGAALSTSLVPFDLTGAVLLHAGYAVGSPPEDSGDGIRFYDFATGQLRGSVPFDQCAPVSFGNTGSVAYVDGVYYAACNDNGIQGISALNPYGGTLERQDAIASTWSGSASFDIDGDVLPLTGPNLCSDGSSACLSLERLDTLPSTGAPSAPQTFGLLFDSQQQPANWVRTRGGTSFVEFFDTVHSIVGAYRPTASGLTQLSTLAFSTTNSAFYPTGADDGRYIYLPDVGTIRIVDTLDATNLTLASSIDLGSTNVQAPLVVDRGTLYVLRGNGSALKTLDTWNVTDPAAPISTGTIAAETPGSPQITSFGVSGGILALGEVDPIQRTSVVLQSLPGNATILTGTDVLGEILVLGDTLLVRQNNSIATYDLTAYLRGSGVPVRLGGQSLPELPFNGFESLKVEGPFAFLMGGQRLRIFDLR